MCLAWLLWLLDALDAPPARPSAGVPSPGAGRSCSATPLAASRTRVGPGPGESPNRGVAALGWGRRGWPPRRRPSARTRSRVSEGSFPVISLILSISASRNRGPSFGREGAGFRLGLRMGCWCPASRFPTSRSGIGARDLSASRASGPGSRIRGSPLASRGKSPEIRDAT
jgi:hypothetical protein